MWKNRALMFLGIAITIFIFLTWFFQEKIRGLSMDAEIKISTYFHIINCFLAIVLGFYGFFLFGGIRTAKEETEESSIVLFFCPKRFEMIMGIIAGLAHYLIIGNHYLKTDGAQGEGMWAIMIIDLPLCFVFDSLPNYDNTYGKFVLFVVLGSMMYTTAAFVIGLGFRKTAQIFRKS
ncbi:hypothetical protein ACFL54_09750 [Planctomycetota bacterium]